MKVSKNSWHYRWLIRMLFVTDNPPVLGRNKVFGWMLFPLTVVKLFQSLTPKQREYVHPLVPRSLCGYFWMNVLGTLLMVVLWPVSAAFVLAIAAPYTAVIAVVFAVLYSFFWTRDTIRGIRYERAQARGYDAPKPSMLLEFVKAKKRRVCPLLDYVD